MTVGMTIGVAICLAIDPGLDASLLRHFVFLFFLFGLGSAEAARARARGVIGTRSCGLVLGLRRFWGERGLAT
jgi:hypothetical protein